MFEEIVNIEKKPEIDIELYRGIHQGEIENRISTETRARVSAWIYPLIALALLILSLMIPEDEYSSLSIVTTAMILSALGISVLGKLGQNQLYIDGRALSDLRNVYGQARNARNFELSKALPKIEKDTKVTLEIIPGDQYISDIAKKWKTHLGILSPTGTGKTTTLELFLSRYTAENRCLILAIEPKDNPWKCLPKENVFRTSLKPTFKQFTRLMEILNYLIGECDRRNELVMSGVIKNHDYEIVIILEEYLTIAENIKILHGDANSKAFLANVYSLLNAGRSASVHAILISQSSVAKDLKMSAGQRSNMRLALMGSVEGGFEAIENALANGYLVSNSKDRERLEALLEYQKANLGDSLQPLLMANFIGGWQIVKMPYVELAPKILTASIVACFPEWIFTGNDTGVATKATLESVIAEQMEYTETIEKPEETNSENIEKLKGIENLFDSLL